MTYLNTNEYGSISVDNDVVATIVGGATNECYGVVGMASNKQIKDGIYELLKKENFKRGVVIRESDNGYTIDVNVILSYSVKVPEVVKEIQKKVAYVLQQTLGMKVDNINVVVKGIKINE